MVVLNPPYRAGLNRAGVINPSASAPFDPSTVAGLIGWWKADALALSDGTAVATWTDSSAAGNNLTQATPANQPTYKTGIVNGKPIVRFDGLASFMRATFTQGPAYSLFAVAKSTSAAAGPFQILNADDVGSHRIFQFEYNTGNLVMVTFTNVTNYAPSQAATFTNWNYLSGVNDGSNAQVFVGGVGGSSVPETGTPNSGAGLFTIGADSTGGPNGFFPGDIAEALMYNNAVTPTNRGKIENYLKAKYGL